MSYQIATVKLLSPSHRDISKSMEIAAKAKGRILSIHIQGQQWDELVVFGDFDSTKLIESLRKKKVSANLMGLQEMTAPEGSSRHTPMHSSFLVPSYPYGYRHY